MISRSLDIFPGTGTDWVLQQVANSCSGADVYKLRFRFKSNGTSPGRLFSRFRYPIDSASGRLLIGSVLSKSELDSLVSAVSTDVQDKRGRGSDTNLYESIAELDKSFALLGAYLQKARSIWSAVKRKDPRALAKDVSSVYLMTRYGLLPTVMDIQHVIKAIEAKLGSVVETSRASTAFKSTSSTNVTTTDAEAINIYGTVFSVKEVIVRGWSLDHLIRTRSLALGLGSKNLATVAWELVPLSFVVDWFVNVGDFLGASVPVFGLTQLSSGYTVTETITDTYDITGATPVDPNTWTVLTPPSGECTQVTRFKRRVAGLRSPTLQVKPDFKFGSFLRCADAYSLLIQLMVGSSRDAVWRR